MIVEQFYRQLSNLVEFLTKLQKRGIAEWDADQDYSQHARVVSATGVLYKALVDTGPTSTNAQDPDAEDTDPRAIWAPEVPDSPPAEFKVLAWGQMGSNGSLLTTPVAVGIDTTASQRTGTSGDYTYEIRLDGDDLADVCRTMVHPSPAIDGRVSIVERVDGMNVKLQDGDDAGIARSFHFVIFGVK